MPLNFIAVRLARGATRTRACSSTTGGLPGEMALTLPRRARSAMALLFVTLWKYEMASKHARCGCARCSARLRRRRPALPSGRSAAPQERLTVPALPLDEAGKYVAAAYLVFLALVLDLRRDHGVRSSAGIERELTELERASREASRVRGRRA